MDCYMLLRLCSFKAKLALFPGIKSIVLTIFCRPQDEQIDTHPLLVLQFTNRHYVKPKFERHRCFDQTLLSGDKISF